jgi:type II secretory ATPase GspE/PulE/Tfp pilus assembly ATPase PilB-like protein
MASPLDDHYKFHPSSAIQKRILSQFQGDWVVRLNVDQMFILIDGVLPFEACLYYQVLPLFLEGNRLNLGMVSPDDISASEYVRRIISYLNYSLVPRQISSDALQVVLTAYLNYVGEKQSTTVKRQDEFSYGHYRNSARAKVTQDLDPNDRNTLVVDSPDDLNLLEDPIDESDPALPPPQIPTGSDQEFLPYSPEAQSAPPATNPSQVQMPPTAPMQPISPSIEEGASLIQALPILAIQSNFLNSSVDVLATLPPHILLQELLARVLLGGIGRLYFEVHPHHGRILWSQNGVLQSVLEKLPLGLFQDVINELKRMARLPQTPIEQPKQAEIEYLYDRSRVLLRFRFMLNPHGEEATLQVLRGAALKFYQQQQVTKLERDALGIAKQLQNKLKEIRDRAYSEQGLAGTKFEILPTLSQLLQTMENELDDLGINRDQESQP